jgi:transposase-like protein
MGIEAGIGKSGVSRICAELDAAVATFRDRPLGHTGFPYIFLRVPKDGPASRSAVG